MSSELRWGMSPANQAAAIRATSAAAAISTRAAVIVDDEAGATAPAAG